MASNSDCTLLSAVTELKTMLGIWGHLGSDEVNVLLPALQSKIRHLPFVRGKDSTLAAAEAIKILVQFREEMGDGHDFSHWDTTGVLTRMINTEIEALVAAQAAVEREPSLIQNPAHSSAERRTIAAVYCGSESIHSSGLKEQSISVTFNIAQGTFRTVHRQLPVGTIIEARSFNIDDYAKALFHGTHLILIHRLYPQKYSAYFVCHSYQDVDWFLMRVLEAAHVLAIQGVTRDRLDNLWIK